MRCPQCGADCIIPEYAHNFAVNYQKSVKVRVSCCSKLVQLTPVFSFRGEALPDGKDDWGN